MSNNQYFGQETFFNENVKFYKDVYVYGTLQGAVQGTQGTFGTQGIQGTQGISGAFVAQGVQGIQGIQGIQGTQGAQGFNGTVGTQGIQGTQGISGAFVAQGIQGIQGVQGVQGSQGTQGAQGNIGLQGIQGRQGIQGSQGIQGTTGNTGTQGTQGITGPTGGTDNQVLYRSGGTATSSSNLTFDGTTFRYNNGYGSAATVYGCRAWVNFDGRGSIGNNQTIRASGNVSSVFKYGTGGYRINFTNALSDSNYASAGCCRDESDDFPGMMFYRRLSGTNTTTQQDIETWYNADVYDCSQVDYVVFR